MHLQIASFARDEIGLSYSSSVNLVIVLNGIGLPARIIPAYLGDRYVGVLNVFIISLVINIIMYWSWLGVDSIGSFYIFTVLYGLSSAAFQSLFTPAITSLGNDITKTGTRIGMAFTVIGFSALVGGPISGALVKADGGRYVAPTIWGAMSTVVGTAVMITARGLKHGWGWKTRC